MKFKRITSVEAISGMSVTAATMEDIIAKLAEIDDVSFHRSTQEAKEREGWAALREVTIIYGKDISYHIQDLLFDKGTPYVGKCWKEEQPRKGITERRL